MKKRFWDLCVFGEFSDLRERARTSRYMKMKSFVYRVETHVGLKRLVAMLELCDHLLRNIPMEELKKYVPEDVLSRAMKLIPPMRDKP